jgi:hypothetical protein
MTMHAHLEVQRCPHCGQAMADVRMGVSLTPLKARIFDAVSRRPGITWDDISRVAFGGEACRETVKAHIWQINETLAAADVEIKGARGPHGGYRLERRRAE